MSDEFKLHEQMALYGKLALSDRQLIECLGINPTAAQKLMAICGNSLAHIAKLTTEDIQRIDGIGKAKATALVAAMEIGRRRQVEIAVDKKQITSSLDCYDILHPLMRDETQEKFFVMFLDRRSKIITIECIYIGGMASMVVDPKVIFQKALQHRACCIILSHNHPSGTSSPSIEDIRITEKLSSAGSFLEIKVLDHIVIGDGSYYSFADEGKIR